jgi:transcriptional regulator with XRE-family HTH domain
MSYAPTLKEIRARFDLRQHELAAWLGLSRSQYSQVEAGIDPLPAHARAWLGPWLSALAVLPPPAPLPPAPPLAGPAPGGGPAALWARLAECRYQAYRLHAPLVLLLSRHLALRARLAAGPSLAAALPPATPAALLARRRWLARFLEAATDGLLPEASAGPVAATLLAARQAAWLHEATWLAAHLPG